MSTHRWDLFSEILLPRKRSVAYIGVVQVAMREKNMADSAYFLVERCFALKFTTVNIS